MARVAGAWRGQEVVQECGAPPDNCNDKLCVIFYVSTTIRPRRGSLHNLHLGAALEILRVGDRHWELRPKVIMAGGRDAFKRLSLLNRDGSANAQRLCPWGAGPPPLAADATMDPTPKSKILTSGAANTEEKAKRKAEQQSQTQNT